MSTMWTLLGICYKIKPYSETRTLLINYLEVVLEFQFQKFAVLSNSPSLPLALLEVDEAAFS